MNGPGFRVRKSGKPDLRRLARFAHSHLRVTGMGLGRSRADPRQRAFPRQRADARQHQRAGPALRLLANLFGGHAPTIQAFGTPLLSR